MYSMYYTTNNKEGKAMSINDILKLTGHKTGNKDIALLKIDGFQVVVQILDVKAVFGRVDCLVTPAQGAGKMWVQLSRLSEVTD